MTGQFGETHLQQTRVQAWQQRGTGPERAIRIAWVDQGEWSLFANPTTVSFEVEKEESSV